MIEYKNFAWRISKAEEEGVVEGLAATFGNIDLQDDIVGPGAFKKTLRESKGIVPILDHHDPSKQIGWNLSAEETEKGLAVRGQLDLNVQAAREKFSLAKKAVELGARMGLSIGFRTIKAEPDKERPSVRRLKEVQLLEYSFATFPANPLAVVTGVKSVEDLNLALLRITQMDEAEFREVKKWLAQSANGKLSALLKDAEPPDGTRKDRGAASGDIDPIIQSMRKVIQNLRR